MNRVSRYLANTRPLTFGRATIIAFWINVWLCHQATPSDGKIFEQCELAQLLRYGHGLDVTEVANWVCIAQHSSSLNTSAFGGNARSGSHGLFQINDQYWCSPPGKGLACGVSCDRLRDDDIADDLECVRVIYNEHQRLSGDGFNAWNAYQQYCRDNPYEYVEDCFGEEEREYLRSISITANSVVDDEDEDYNLAPHRQGKVYGRCELARELFLKHKVPMEEIPVWVCIAQHESNYDTSAVGRLNGDGSADHGLFQISDLYWCSHKGGKRKACGLSCNKLIDSDITDDLKCVRQIFKEHTRISGDGFTAWTVYNAYCQVNTESYVRGCFDGIDVNDIGKAEEYQKYEEPTKHRKQRPQGKGSISPNSIDDYPSKGGKKYGRCELAKELLSKHEMSMDDIPTWVCIAQHESNYDTSAVGRLNTDGSADHGLFQISDLYWCSHKEEDQKACGLPCSKLLDKDISDDVKCVKQIFDEHTRISGNGFTAWTVYNAHCAEKAEQYIRGCFDGTYPEEDFIPSEKEISTGKVYEECELANELRDVHNVPKEQIPTWVCIAKRHSGLDTSSSFSNVHGLFHISDEFWCSPPGKGKACGVSCAELEDNDISNDVGCAMKIFEEHQGLSGNGFNAWSAYSRHCNNGRANEYISKCPGFESVKSFFGVSQSFGSVQRHSPRFQVKNKPKGKVYEECELASELQNNYRLPKEQVPIWVCIAKHQSGLDTSSAVGNVHGIFHISNEFWCSPSDIGKACDINCADLEDSDINDDVECAKKIFQEHQGLSGNGFNAWTTYSRYCSNGRANQYVASCPGFESGSAFISSTPAKNLIQHHHVSYGLQGKNKPKGKVYEECELARELRDKHLIPNDQISTWVCIAKHHSGLDTSSSVINAHGLFHISDEFWCSLSGERKACEISCSDLEDSDISDDIQCIARIYEEHHRLSGNGFNAWLSYSHYCSDGRADEYVSNCPEFSNSRNFLGHPHTSVKVYPTLRVNSISLNRRPVYSHVLSDNVFLKHYDLVNSEAAYSLNSIETGDVLVTSEEADDHIPAQTVFSLNPFLKTLISETASGGQTPGFTVETATSAPAFNLNPFLKQLIDSKTSSSEDQTQEFAIRTSTSAPAFVGTPIAPTPTTSSLFETYEPQKEESIKSKAFKTFTVPTVSFPSQTPRPSRLQIYTLKTLATPTLPFATTSAPTRSRLQPYQLNTFRTQPLNTVNSVRTISTSTTRAPITISNFRRISTSNTRPLSKNVQSISTPLTTIDEYGTPTTSAPVTIDNAFGSQKLNTIGSIRTLLTPTTRAPITISNYRPIATSIKKPLNNNLNTLSTPLNTINQYGTSTTPTPITIDKFRIISSPTIQPLKSINKFKTISKPTSQPLNTVSYFRATPTPTTHAPVTINNYRTIPRPTIQPLNTINQFPASSTATTSTTIQPLNTINTTRQPLNKVSYFRAASTTKSPNSLGHISSPINQPLSPFNKFKTTSTPTIRPSTPSTVSYFRTSTTPNTSSQNTLGYLKSIISPTTPSTSTLSTRPIVHPGLLNPDGLARPFSVKTSTTKAPAVFQGTGRYDARKYDSGRYDSGRYDPARYEHARYSSNRGSSSTTTLRPSTISASPYHRVTSAVFDSTPSNIKVTTIGLSGQHYPFKQTTTLTTQAPFSSTITPITTGFTRYNGFRNFITPTVRPTTLVSTSFTDSQEPGQYYPTPSLPTTVSPTTQAFFATTSKPYNPFAAYRFGQHPSNSQPFNLLPVKSIGSNELDYDLNTNTKRETLTIKSQSPSSITSGTKAIAMITTSTLRPVITATTVKPAFPRTTTRTTSTTVKSAYVIPSKSGPSSTAKPASTRSPTTKARGNVASKTTSTPSTTARRPVTKSQSKPASSGSAGQPTPSTGAKSTINPVFTIKLTPSSSTSRQLKPTIYKFTTTPTRSTAASTPTRSRPTTSSLQRSTTVRPALKPTTKRPTTLFKSLNPSTPRPTTTISPTKHRPPSGSLFTPNLNIFDLYYKLYGISPSSLKTSSTTSRPETTIHVASSRTS